MIFWLVYVFKYLGNYVRVARLICNLQKHKILCGPKNISKGAWLFKFLQRQIGGIPKCVEIFEKNFQYAFLDVPSYILDEKN